MHKQLSKKRSKDYNHTNPEAKSLKVAAMNPLAVNKDGIDSKTIEKEIEVGKDQAIQEGKPAEMAEKIALGRLNKFFKENTLLSQQFVRDNKSFPRADNQDHHFLLQEL